MQPIPETPAEALEVFRNPDSEDWERDYAAMMITSLEEALPDLVTTACDATASEACSKERRSVSPLPGGTVGRL